MKANRGWSNGWIGMRRNAESLSVFAICVHLPNLIKHSTASSKEAYLTEDQAGSMKSLTDEPLGKLKWWISLNWPGAFFGTIPIGLIFVSGKGARKKVL